MATKLTLRLDEGVIRNAKRAAPVRGVSLSHMVAGYLQSVSEEKMEKTEATPALAEITRVLSPKMTGKRSWQATANISRRNTGENCPGNINFILDIFLERKPFYSPAARIFAMIEAKHPLKQRPAPVNLFGTDRTVAFFPGKEHRRHSECRILIGE